jgi:GT2 family glycosyltransferase
MTKPVISIIIISYNTWHYLQPCVESIREHFIQIPYEVIVVDNDSTDKSNQLIKSYFPDVVLIQNTYNAGFARANNQAAEIAKGDYFFLLNADTLIMNDMIVEAIKFMKNNNVAVLGPKLINDDNMVQISYQDSNTVFTPLGNIINSIIGMSSTRSLYVTPSQYIRQVGFLTGSALLIDAAIVKQYGLFDERFFFMTEERDFCYRLCRKDLKIIYFPDWTIKHYVHSGDLTNPFHTINWIKSTIKFEIKHCGQLLGLAAWSLFLLMLVRNITVLSFRFIISHDHQYYRNMVINHDIFLWHFGLKSEEEVYRRDR